MMKLSFLIQPRSHVLAIFKPSFVLPKISWIKFRSDQWCYFMHLLREECPLWARIQNSHMYLLHPLFHWWSDHMTSTTRAAEVLFFWKIIAYSITDRISNHLLLCLCEMVKALSFTRYCKTSPIRYIWLSLSFGHYLWYYSTRNVLISVPLVEKYFFIDMIIRYSWYQYLPPYICV